MECSEELAGGLLRAAPDAILVMDEGRIVMVNDRAEEVFGWSRDTLLGQHASVLLTETSWATYPAGRQRGSVSLDCRRRDGTEFPAEATLATVPNPPGELVVAVVRDLTERHRAEAEQHRLRSEAQAQRQARLDSLGQLAGGIAHDFNNMLGVIVNYASFVIEEATGPSPDLKTIAADAEQVIRAGRRGTDLTHQLLSFARRDVVRPEVLDLNRVLAEVEGLLRRSLGEHIRLDVRPAAALPPVTCDPGQLEQVLVSLAVNARDAMPGGGTLVIDTTAVRRDDGEWVRLRVCDSGRGMTPEVAERAFEPFFTTKPNGEGTGLGLATVYGVVTQAGGDVHLSSSLGFGTTVTVLLPASAAAPEPAAAPAPAPPVAGHGETLLVVEDEAALREVAGRILSGAGYKVLAADGGVQALELAALHEGAIDLLVSDVVMPGMLGKELAERLVEVRPDTRVLYMSGYAQPVLASQGTLDPGVALLEKPFTASDLLAAVRSRLDG